jgi:hypothetical protein
MDSVTAIVLLVLPLAIPAVLGWFWFARGILRTWNAEQEEWRQECVRRHEDYLRHQAERDAWNAQRQAPTWRPEHVSNAEVVRLTKGGPKAAA